MITPGQPVDGFTVDRDGEKVVLIMSNRYGDIDEYLLSVESALEIAGALLLRASE